MYSLPEEYWSEGSLKRIGNRLGEYIKAAEETKLRRYTSYARICVFMRLDNALPDLVSLSHEDYEWIQPLDYEHVPFRCRKCHAHRHLFRDCPLNQKASDPDSSDTHAQEGFTKVPSRKRAHKKPSSGNKPLKKWPLSLPQAIALRLSLKPQQSLPPACKTTPCLKPPIRLFPLRNPLLLLVSPKIKLQTSTIAKQNQREMQRKWKWREPLLNQVKSTKKSRITQREPPKPWRRTTCNIRPGSLRSSPRTTVRCSIWRKNQRA